MNSKNGMVKNTFFYALVQGFFWIIFVAAPGYTSVYLLDAGLNNSEVGIVIGIAGIAAAIMQPTIAGYADKPSAISLKRIVIIAICAEVVFAAALMLTSGKAPVVSGVLFCCLIAILQCLIPFVYSLGTEKIKNGEKLNWGVARGTGSGMYAVVAIILGGIVESKGSGSIPLALVICFVLFLAAVVIFPFVKYKPEASGANESSASRTRTSSASPVVFLKKYKKYSLMLVGTTFLYVSHVLVSSFLYQIVEYKGGGSEELGIAMSISAVVEIPTLFFFGFLAKKKGGYFWMRLSGIAMAVKAIGTFLVPVVSGLYLVQIIQILGYALLTVASVHYVSSIMRPEDAIKGQAYLGMTNTLGSVIASFAGGAILDAGGAPAMMIFSIVASGAGAIIVFASVEKVE